MKLYYDLHIHSALSPCCDDDMTPNNIVRMARLKELNLIAVTDHNSARNLPAVQSIAQACGLLLLPGIEVTTAEEVHVLTYFSSVAKAVAFGDRIYDSLPNIRNREDIFGNQYVMNEKDEIVGKLDKLLVNACPYSVDDLCRQVRREGGVPVPAHVNRGSNSLLSNFGFIPDDLLFSTIEVNEGISGLKIDPARYRVLHSSDAHSIENIAEPNHFLTCGCSVRSVLQEIGSGLQERVQPS